MHESDGLIGDAQSMLDRAYDNGFREGVQDGRLRAAAVVAEMASAAELDGNRETAAALRMAADQILLGKGEVPEGTSPDVRNVPLVPFAYTAVSGRAVFRVEYCTPDRIWELYQLMPDGVWEAIETASSVTSLLENALDYLKSHPWAFQDCGKDHAEACFRRLLLAADEIEAARDVWNRAVEDAPHAD